MDYSQLVTYVPGLLAASKVMADVFGSTSWRHVERLVALADKTTGPAKTRLDALIHRQVVYLTAKDERRLERKVDWASIATLVVLAAVSTGLIIWIRATDLLWLQITLGSITAFVLLLMAVGFTSIFEYPNDAEGESK